VFNPLLKINCLSHAQIVPCINIHTGIHDLYKIVAIHNVKAGTVVVKKSIFTSQISKHINHMKYFLSLIFMVGLFSTTLIAENTKSVAHSPDQISQVLKMDKSLIAKEFSSLEALEDRIKSENLTYLDLDAETVQGLSLKADVSGSLLAIAGADDLPLGLPGFWWGFCLSWVGILLVYLLMEDSADRKEQVKKAVIGALVGIGIWIVFWILFWASFAVV
jgi:hypothetical protein